MTFNSISSLTSQGELATLGVFACSFTAFPVVSLPSDSLLPIVIENQSDRPPPAATAPISAPTQSYIPQAVMG